MNIVSTFLFFSNLLIIKNFDPNSIINESKMRSAEIQKYTNTFWRHYKGKFYQTLGLAELRQESLVFYKSTYAKDDFWLRPKIMFDGNVEFKNRLVKRFEFHDHTQTGGPAVSVHTLDHQKLPPTFKIPQYTGFYEPRKGGQLLRCLGSATHTETLQHFVVAERLDESEMLIALGLEGFQIDYKKFVIDQPNVE